MGSPRRIFCAQVCVLASSCLVAWQPASRGSGLPRLKSPFEHGNLFIVFTIEFPSSINPAAASELLKLSTAHLDATNELSKTFGRGTLRKIAAAEGIDLTTINGTGPGGRIVRKDVEGAPGSSAPTAAVPSITLSVTSPDAVDSGSLFFSDTATTAIHTPTLHDALPI